MRPCVGHDMTQCMDSMAPCFMTWDHVCDITLYMESVAWCHVHYMSLCVWHDMRLCVWHDMTSCVWQNMTLHCYGFYGLMPCIMTWGHVFVMIWLSVWNLRPSRVSWHEAMCLSWHDSVYGLYDMMTLHICVPVCHQWRHQPVCSPVHMCQCQVLWSIFSDSQKHPDQNPNKQFWWTQ